MPQVSFPISLEGGKDLEIIRWAPSSKFANVDFSKDNSIKIKVRSLEKFIFAETVGPNRASKSENVDFSLDCSIKIEFRRLTVFILVHDVDPNRGSKYEEADFS